MRVLLCLAHSIEEHDQLSLLHSLGYEVASLGAYIDPARPHDDKRPPLEVPCYDEVFCASEESKAAGVDPQEEIPTAILDWLGDDGVMIWHHYLQDKLFPQWGRLHDWKRGGSGRRIIWRTVGQSVEHNEKTALPFRRMGLEIVRYSPKERAIPGFVGEDALIRFWKDPDEWYGWTGEDTGVTNVSQDMLRRDPWCNPAFWLKATVELPVRPMGTGSDELGGTGTIDYETMKDGLRRARAYLYTGTQPASYTLGLLEALMTGIPVVSIGPEHMTIFPYGSDLFEAHEFCGTFWSNDPEEAREMLYGLLSDYDLAKKVSQHQRHRAKMMFSRERVAKDWKAFLG